MSSFPPPSEMTPDMLDVMRSDALVQQCWKAGLSLEQTVVELSRARAELILHVVRLEAIAPRRIKNPETGQILVYRCPDELVPVEG